MGKHAAVTTPLLSRLPTVAELLEILPDGWTVVPGLHDLVPELAEADQVVVGPGGIFVILAPEWVAPFSVDDGVVVAGGVTRERETEACLDTAVAVARLAGTYAEWIVPVLCVTSEELLLEWAMEARICSLASLVDALTGAPVVLPPAHVRNALQVLQSAVEPPPVPRPAQQSAPDPAPAPEPAPVPTAPSATATEAHEPTDAAVAADESTSSRSRRVAAAMAAAEATAAQVAADQAARGVAPGESATKRSGESASRIKSLVALVVAVVVVGGLGLNYERVLPAVHGVYDQLSGAPACVPTASDTQTLTTKPIPVPRTDKHGKPLGKAARAKARKRAAARAKRLAVRPVSAPALDAAAC